jgi:hypothetical protein
LTSDAQSSHVLRLATLVLAANHIRCTQPNHPAVQEVTPRMRSDARLQLVSLVRRVDKSELDCNFLAAVMSNIYSDVCAVITLCTVALGFVLLTICGLEIICGDQQWHDTLRNVVQRAFFLGGPAALLGLDRADSRHSFKPRFGNDRLALRIYLEQLVGFEAFGGVVLRLNCYI